MAKLSFDLAAMTAAYTAKGGKIESVAQGARAIESDRTIYTAMRAGKRAQADSVRESRAAESRAAESRHEIMVGAYHAAKAMGWSYEDAMEYGATAVD